MYDFSANDVFEMAEQMERNGADFYKDAAQAAGNETVKNMLSRLAAMEEAHEKTFAALRSGLGDADKAATVFDPDGQSTQYLQALVKTKVFFEKEIDITSLEGVLISAIGAEKDSIIFYLGMRDAVPEGKGKERIDAIIKEEMGHVQILSQELVKLNK